MKQREKQIWKWWFKGLSALIIAFIAIGGGYGFGAIFRYVTRLQSQEAVDLALRSTYVGVSALWVISTAMSVAIVWFFASFKERRLSIGEWITQVTLGSFLIAVAVPTAVLSSLVMSELSLLSHLLDVVLWIGGISLIAYVMSVWILPHRQLLLDGLKRK